jgi:hypothetical protein
MLRHLFYVFVSCSDVRWAEIVIFRLSITAYDSAVSIREGNCEVISVLD